MAPSGHGERERCTYFNFAVAVEPFRSRIRARRSAILQLKFRLHRELHSGPVKPPDRHSYTRICQLWLSAHVYTSTN
jgi:hypothetical protein